MEPANTHQPTFASTAWSIGDTYPVIDPETGLFCQTFSNSGKLLIVCLDTTTGQIVTQATVNQHLASMSAI